jgi:hypothetical protein
VGTVAHVHAGNTTDVTDELGQAALGRAAADLIARLGACTTALRPIGDAEQLQHREFASRARLLAMYVEQALRATEVSAYPAAFALLRTALEHRLFDRLLFLASVHTQVIEGVSEETWQRWQADPPPYLHAWERGADGRVRVTWTGPRVLDEDGRVLYTLSIYYKWWKDYDPLVTPSRDFEQIAAGHPSHKVEHAAYHKIQREMWHRALVWSGLKSNLLLNGLASERELTQLEVHYRFLSAFVHPFSEDVTDHVYHPHYHGDWPIEDHYALELVLLYACTFAIDELRDFERMSTREPRVDLAGWDAVRVALADGEAQTAHLWAPGRAPYSYDRINEANQRAFDAYDAEHDAGRPMTRPRIADPRLLRDDEIRYYPDPLRRLVRLHAGFNEMTTGLSWQSPWPRADARFR